MLIANNIFWTIVGLFLGWVFAPVRALTLCYKVRFPTRKFIDLRIRAELRLMLSDNERKELHTRFSQYALATKIAIGKNSHGGWVELDESLLERTCSVLRKFGLARSVTVYDASGAHVLCALTCGDLLKYLDS